MESVDVDSRNWDENEIVGKKGMLIGGDAPAEHLSYIRSALKKIQRLYNIFHLPVSCLLQRLVCPCFIPPFSRDAEASMRTNQKG